ncbi:hypothetical protein HMPREF0973_00112 [Prevotella veroralis F0319]|uniref:Uncharacterized protein n=1 Tax=Prevotella veroralis F0319 TaxID=649761 RepID=C9MKK4_9BACT|nr:hypothetical protein HMPREF0973_00112 [Prevotella veroralis F0319]
MEVKPLETPPNLPERKRRSLTPNPTTASPPPPLRMEQPHPASPKGRSS